MKIRKALKTDPFHDSLVAIMAESGLRKGEALGLTWSDLFNGNGGGTPLRVFVIRGQWDDRRGFVPTKTGQARKGFLFYWGIEALKEHRKATKPKDKKLRVWPSAESTVWRWWTSFQRSIGIDKPYRVHDLRHTAAINVLRKTKDITLAQRLLGHKSIETTMAYAQRPDDEVRDEIAKMIRK